MFLIRSVEKKDANDLFKLSQHVSFVSLPRDLELIEKKITRSIKSFKKPEIKQENNCYVFVLIDLSTNVVIGVSMINSQHGTKEEPHFFLNVSSEHKYSKTLNTGFIHGTLKLGYDTNGPTEVGGLVLHPKYRGHIEKLGKKISFVRFLYIGLNPRLFKQEIHSELMPPLDSEGRSCLWEAVGRRFLNMDYYEADKLSRSNKEFILNLFPAEIIYETLLPLEARNAIGKVGNDTLPVKKMFEKIGFKYVDQVDPFDGGPHYRAKVNDISLIKNMINGNIRFTKKINNESARDVMISLEVGKDKFSACGVRAEVSGDKIIIDSKSFFKTAPQDTFTIQHPLKNHNSQYYAFPNLPVDKHKMKS